ncbi:MAG: MFS transporter [Phycisphaerales bacterium]|nr:MFS transporter [Phycisphaerales bacterium]
MVALAQGYWMVLAAQVIASIGAPGYFPIAGELFRHLYPERSRGRVYAIVWGASMVGGILCGLGAGRWLAHNGEAFRFLMPIAAGLQLIGVYILARLSRATGISAARDARAAARERDPEGHPFACAFEPILHMREVLRADPVFFRYEAAYMTYGIGWMIAYALLPLIGTDKLKLGYDQYTQSTQVAYQVAIVAMIGPAGWLLDRLGAMRSVGLSFGLLALYPLGLIVARDADQLMLVSVIYGIAHAGASVGWMLGPVALAPDQARVPQYVAIHATLVGLRGTVFQGLGMALYRMTDSFTWPLILAAAAYLWSAAQMWTLHGQVRAAGRGGASPETPVTPETPEIPHRGLEQAAEFDAPPDESRDQDFDQDPAAPPTSSITR